MASVAATIAQTLKAYDTKYFFQVTGGDQALWIALEEAGIQMIPCRSEKGAAYMADGYARISGKPGFVYGQYGPGVSNVAAGLADPYWSMSPVISFTTSMRTPSRDRYEYQELDQLPLHTSLTRWNKAVARPERAAEMPGVRPVAAAYFFDAMEQGCGSPGTRCGNAARGYSRCHGSYSWTCAS